MISRIVNPRWGMKFKAAIAVLIVGVVYYLVNDARPIENDYSLEDIRSPAQNARESHATLLTFRKGGDHKVEPGIPHLGKDERYMNVLTYAEEIEKGRENIAEARSVIARLDEFDAIGDLTEPKVDSPISSYVAYRNTAQTYWAYAALRTAQGKPAEPQMADNGLEGHVPMRDPFWPIGWVLPKIVHTQKIKRPVSPIRWADALKRLGVSALSKKPDGSYVAIR